MKSIRTLLLLAAAAVAVSGKGLRGAENNDEVRPSRGGLGCGRRGLLRHSSSRRHRNGAGGVGLCRDWAPARLDWCCRRLRGSKTRIGTVESAPGSWPACPPLVVRTRPTGLFFPLTAHISTCVCGRPHWKTGPPQAPALPQRHYQLRCVSIERDCCPLIDRHHPLHSTYHIPSIHQPHRRARRWLGRRVGQVEAAGAQRGRGGRGGGRGQAEHQWHHQQRCGL